MDSSQLLQLQSSCVSSVTPGIRSSECQKHGQLTTATTTIQLCIISSTWDQSARNMDSSQLLQLQSSCVSSVTPGIRSSECQKHGQLTAATTTTQLCIISSIWDQSTRNMDSSQLLQLQSSCASSIAPGIRVPETWTAHNCYNYNPAVHHQ